MGVQLPAPHRRGRSAPRASPSNRGSWSRTDCRSGSSAPSGRRRGRRARPVQVLQPRHREARQQQGLERPGRPIGHDREPARSLHHHPLARGPLPLGQVEQQRCRRAGPAIRAGCGPRARPRRGRNRSPRSGRADAGWSSPSPRPYSRTPAPRRSSPELARPRRTRRRSRRGSLRGGSSGRVSE